MIETFFKITIKHALNKNNQLFFNYIYIFCKMTLFSEQIILFDVLLSDYIYYVLGCLIYYFLLEICWYEFLDQELPTPFPWIECAWQLCP